MSVTSLVVATARLGVDRALLVGGPAQGHDDGGAVGVVDQPPDEPPALDAAVDPVAHDAEIVGREAPRDADHLPAHAVVERRLRLDRVGEHLHRLGLGVRDLAALDAALDLPVAEPGEDAGDDEREGEHRDPARATGDLPHRLGEHGTVVSTRDGALLGLAHGVDRTRGRRRPRWVPARSRRAGYGGPGLSTRGRAGGSTAGRTAGPPARPRSPAPSRRGRRGRRSSSASTSSSVARPSPSARKRARTTSGAGAVAVGTTRRRRGPTGSPSPSSSSPPTPDVTGASPASAASTRAISSACRSSRSRRRASAAASRARPPAPQPEHGGADALGVRREQRPHHRHDQHVEPGERLQQRVEPRPGRQRRQDERELAAVLQDERRVEAGLRPQLVEPGDELAGHEVEGDRDADRRRHRAEHAREQRRVEPEPEVEEEERAEHVAHGQRELLHPVAVAGRPDDEADEEGADRVRHAEHLAEPGEEHREPEEEDGEELVVAGAHELRDDLAAPARDREHRHEEGERDRQLDDHRDRVGLAADDDRDDREVDRDEDVLDHGHPEDHRRLAVRQPVQLDEQLRHDRARRRGRHARHDERLARAPAEHEAEREADPHVDGDVGAARHDEAARVPEELVLVELEAEVEQEQDQPEDRDQLDAVRVEADREPARVRARQQADDHVDRDRGQADQLARASEPVGQQQQVPRTISSSPRCTGDQLPGGASTAGRCFSRPDR